MLSTKQQTKLSKTEEKDKITMIALEEGEKIIWVDRNISDTAAEQKPLPRGVWQLADVDCSLLLSLEVYLHFFWHSQSVCFPFIVFRM